MVARYADSIGKMMRPGLTLLFTAIAILGMIFAIQLRESSRTLPGYDCNQRIGTGRYDDRQVQTLFQRILMTPFWVNIRNRYFASSRRNGCPAASSRPINC